MEEKAAAPADNSYPYFLVYTNTPGEIVYEDQYQIAAKTDGFLQIDETQSSWGPTGNKDSDSTVSFGRNE